MKKAKTNYWVDVGIGISFILSSISGLVFLLPIAPGTRILGVGFALWSRLHTWSSIGMILGVAAHLALDDGTLRLRAPGRRAFREAGPGVSSCADRFAHLLRLRPTPAGARIPGE